jgi:hypothetical protein
MKEQIVHCSGEATAGMELSCIWQPNEEYLDNLRRKGTGRLPRMTPTNQFWEEF